METESESGIHIEVQCDTFQNVFASLRSITPYERIMFLLSARMCREQSKAKRDGVKQFHARELTFCT